MVGRQEEARSGIVGRSGSKSAALSAAADQPIGAVVQCPPVRPNPLWLSASPVEPFLFPPRFLGISLLQFFECGGLSGRAGRFGGCAGGTRPLGVQIGALKERLTAIPLAGPFRSRLARVNERSSFSSMQQQQMSCALRSGAEQSGTATRPATAGPS
jgi:hypothetical protein